MKKEKMIDKIKKLLELATSDNPHEAQLAMTKAQALMVEHNIEMQEVEEQEQEDVIKATSDSWGRGQFRRSLGVVISDNFRCISYINCRKNLFRIVFLGKESDAKIALMVYECAVKIAEQGAEKEYQSAYYNGLPTKGIKPSFKAGFLEGLINQFEDQKRNNQEWGLVLVTPKEVTEKYEVMSKDFAEPSKNINTDLNIADLIAFENGMVAGYQFKAQERIE